MVIVTHNFHGSGKQSEILNLATSMEDHKSEIENWDLGAGIYLTFYALRTSLKENDDTMTELVRKFFRYMFVVLSN